jgi:hypothetical protein
MSQLLRKRERRSWKREEGEKLVQERVWEEEELESSHEEVLRRKEGQGEMSSTIWEQWEWKEWVWREGGPRERVGWCSGWRWELERKVHE